MTSRKEIQNVKKEKSLKGELVSAVKFKKEREKIKERGKKGGIVVAIASFGVLGWNLIVPVILMLIIAKVLVRKFDLGDIWTMNFLFIGLAIGIYNCYKEIKREYKKGLKITEEFEKKKEKN